MEKTNVLDIYNLIAVDFSRTRYSVWPSVKNFIESFSNKAQFLEVGCGNGKNMLLRPSNFTGCDNCENFIKICKKRNLNVIQACATNLPFKSNNFDGTLSVAVIHHLSTIERREKAINELVRVTKPGGLIFIEVWAFENNNRVIDKNQDSLVPWNYNGKVFQRFYHFFKKEEIIKIVQKFKNVELLSITNEKFNWIIILKKLF